MQGSGKDRGRAYLAAPKAKRNDNISSADRLRRILASSVPDATRIRTRRVALSQRREIVRSICPPQAVELILTRHFALLHLASPIAPEFSSAYVVQASQHFAWHPISPAHQLPSLDSVDWSGPLAMATKVDIPRCWSLPYA